MCSSTHSYTQVLLYVIRGLAQSGTGRFVDEKSVEGHAESTYKYTM